MGTNDVFCKVTTKIQASEIKATKDTQNYVFNGFRRKVDYANDVHRSALKIQVTKCIQCQLALLWHGIFNLKQFGQMF